MGIEFGTDNSSVGSWWTEAGHGSIKIAENDQNDCQTLSQIGYYWKKDSLEADLQFHKDAENTKPRNL